MQNSVHGIFIKNANISISVDIHFECFELKAGFVRFVVKGDGAKVRQIGLGADSRVLRNDNRDFISLVLIGKRLDVRQCGGNPTFRVTLVVAQLGGCAFPLRFLLPILFTPLPLLPSTVRPVSSIPVGLGLEVCGTASPRGRSCPGRLRKTPSADAPAWSMTHEFRTFGFEGAIRDRWPLVDTSHMLVAMFFARDKDSYRHNVAVIQ